MHRPKWWRWALASAVLTGGLVVGLAVPASAATVQVSMSVTPGGSFDLLCPEGERVLELGGGFASTATFYSNANRTKVVASITQGEGEGVSLVLDAEGWIVGITYTAPRKARFVDASVTCAAVPVVTAGEPTCNPDGSASVPFVVTNPDPEATVIVDLDYIIGSSQLRSDATAGELAPGESLGGSVTVPVELVRTGETVVFVAEVSYPDGMSYQSISNQAVLPGCTPAQV